VDPVPDPLLFFFFSGSAGNRTRASGSVAKNSDHWTTEAVEYCHYYNYILGKNFSLALVYGFHVKFIRCVLNLSQCCRVCNCWYITFSFVICRNILQFIFEYKFMFKTPVTHRLSVSRQQLNGYTRRGAVFYILEKEAT
jgi:hypothetical protein